MARVKCAASTLGVAIALGALIGAGVTFVALIVQQQSLPSAQGHPLQWEIVAYAGVVALAGGVAGMLVGMAAWSIGSAVFLIAERLASHAWVRAVAVGLGSGLGTAIVLIAIASQPGMSAAGPFVAGAIAAAMALAVGALLITQRALHPEASSH